MTTSPASAAIAAQRGSHGRLWAAVPLAAALLLALTASSAHATPDLLAATNADRAGLPPLTESPALDAIAQARVDDQVDRDYFAHVDPDGNTVFSKFGGYCFLHAGENIGMWVGEPADVEALFMASPEHRANILGSWSEMGFGMATTSDGSWIVDVLFAQPCVTAQPSASDSPAVPTQSIDAPATARPTLPATSTVRGGAGLLVWGAA
jgi:uncharacterized protein YkwD